MHRMFGAGRTASVTGLPLVPVPVFTPAANLHLHPTLEQVNTRQDLGCEKETKFSLQGWTDFLFRGAGLRNAGRQA